MQGIKAPDPFEEHAFEELVDFYQTSLLRMCYLNLHDLGLAEDAVQETYVKAYRAMPSFRGDSDIKTWLIRLFGKIIDNRFQYQHIIAFIVPSTKLHGLPGKTIFIQACFKNGHVSKMGEIWGCPFHV